MNTNYGNDQRKPKKRKNAKTPLDFESSMGSTSALLMMDGGTGSENVNLKQQHIMQMNGINQMGGP